MNMFGAIGGQFVYCLILGLGCAFACVNGSIVVLYVSDLSSWPLWVYAGS